MPVGVLPCILRGVLETSRSVRSAEGSNQLVAFFILSYGISWSLWVPAAIFSGPQPSSLALALVFVGAFGPTLAAVVLTNLRGGKVDLKELLGRLLAWHVGLRWYMVVLFGTVAIGLLTVVLEGLMGGPAPGLSPTVPWHFLPPAFLIGLLVGGPLNEEVGWRGYALPKLQEGMRALTASLVLGVFWALWHLPLFFVAGTSQADFPFVPFVLWVVALSVLFAWVYNGTGGSLLVVVLAHGAVNFTAGFLFPIFPALAGGVRPFVIYTALFVVAAALVVLFTGPELFSRKTPAD